MRISLAEHVIERYKERVLADKRRKIRSDDEIRGIIINSFKASEKARNLLDKLYEQGFHNCNLSLRLTIELAHYNESFGCYQFDIISSEDCGRFTAVTMHEPGRRKSKSLKTLSNSKYQRVG